jgi:flagellar biosynthetic protein FliR
MHILGMVIATISGLGSAMLFDPTQGTQGTLVGNFLNNLAIILLFHSNIDHLLIQFIINSYSIFNISQKVKIDFITTEMVSLISDVFEIAIKLALPQITIALTVMISGGILGRLMPSLQIFNLFTPIQMVISFVILMVTLSASMNWYINNIYDLLKKYLFG